MHYALTVFIIGFLILIHELGHFLAARSAGIPIERFSVGFGPVLGRYRRKGTEFCLSLVPLGGYVVPAIGDEEDFFRIPVYKRIIFSLGGPAANVMLGVILLAVMNATSAGLSFNGIFLLPFQQAAAWFGKIAASFGHIFSRTAELSGLIGITVQGKEFIVADIGNALRFAVILSMNLAVFNLLPVPALDGGKILLYLLEKVHPRFAKIHLPLALAGWAVLLVLMLYSTWLDVLKYVVRRA
jgi:regulator of sigma E protease